jgi:chromosome segregation ATPase
MARCQKQIVKDGKKRQCRNVVHSGKFCWIHSKKGGDLAKVKDLREEEYKLRGEINANKKRIGSKKPEDPSIVANVDNFKNKVQRLQQIRVELSAELQEMKQGHEKLIGNRSIAEEQKKALKEQIKVLEQGIKELETAISNLDGHLKNISSNPMTAFTKQ